MSDSNNNTGKIVGSVGLGLILIKSLTGLEHCGPLARFFAKEKSVIHYADDAWRIGTKTEELSPFILKPASKGDDINRIFSEMDVIANEENAKTKFFYNLRSQPTELKSTKIFLEAGYLSQEQQKACNAIIGLDKSLEGRRAAIQFMVYRNHGSLELERLKSSLSKYVEQRNILKSAFGEESSLVKNLDYDVFEANVLRSVEESIAISNGKLIPEKLKLVPNTKSENDIYSLLTGRKLDKNQAELLTKLTGRNLSRSTDDFDNCILIKQESDGQYLVNTTSSTSMTTSFNGTLTGVSTKNKRIILDGKIDAEFAKYLSGKKVTCVDEFSHFIDDANKSKKNTEIIYVASTEESELVKLYGISSDQAKKLSKVFREVSNQPSAKIVNSKQALLTELRIAKENQKNTIVVFHNQNGKLFDEPIERYKIKNVITCKSYSMDGNQFANQTTDFVYIEDVINSFKKISTEKKSYNEIYHEFATHYNRELARRETKFICATVGIGVGTTGTVAGIVYYNLKKS